MEFQFNRDKATLLNVMKTKAAKKNLKMKSDEDRVEICLENGKFHNGEDAIPVVFKGKLKEDSGNCSLTGRFTYGFYLYSLVIFAIVLIIVRFVWSVWKNQTKNIILCGIVAALLIVVIAVVWIKSKKPRMIIEDFLNNLNVK